MFKNLSKGDLKNYSELDNSNYDPQTPQNNTPLSKQLGYYNSRIAQGFYTPGARLSNDTPLKIKGFGEFVKINLKPKKIKKSTLVDLPEVDEEQLPADSINQQNDPFIKHSHSFEKESLELRIGEELEGKLTEDEKREFRLLKLINNSKFDMSTLKEKCIACDVKVPDSVFHPCGHGGICFECASTIIAKKPICHYCRADILKVFQIDIHRKHKDIHQILDVYNVKIHAVQVMNESLNSPD